MTIVMMKILMKKKHLKVLFDVSFDDEELTETNIGGEWKKCMGQLHRS